MKTNPPENGFTLVELAVVAFILSLLAALSASAFRRSYGALSEETAIADLLSVMDFAKERALLEGISYGVHWSPGSNAYWLLRGSARAPGEWGLARQFPMGLRLQEPEDSISFAPDGTASGAAISFKSSEHSFTLAVDPLTGKGAVHEAS